MNEREKQKYFDILERIALALEKLENTVSENKDCSCSN